MKLASYWHDTAARFDGAVARQVLLATGTSAVGPLAWFRRRIVPVGAYIIVTEPLPQDLLDRILPRRRNATNTRNLVTRRCAEPACEPRHRETAPLFTGSCRFNRRVERQDVGLERDAVNDADDDRDLLAAVADALHGGDDESVGAGGLLLGTLGPTTVAAAALLLL